MLPLTPKALFVGREEETQTYLNFLQQEKQWVFLITGMPGQGKSRFLTHLSTNTPPDVLTVKLDFANHALQVEPLKVLEEVAWRTELHCDAARANLFIETLQDARKQLVEQNFEIVYHLRSPAQKLDVDTKREMQDMSLVLREQVLQAFYAQLSTFHTGRLALMFDTCEWLNESDGIETGNWFKDILLPGLHRYVPVSLYIVLASRTQPQFDSIQTDEQQACELRSLDEIAVNQYMELLGIEHKAQWYDLFTLAHGHPLCMSIIATLWQERQDERTNSDFPLLEKKFTEQASIEFFQERLDRRLKFPFRELTHYGVLLRSFDWELLRVIFPELLIGPESYTQFEQFIGYSFIETFEEQGTKRYALHVLLREVMVQTIHEQEPDKWETYHERAYLYYHEHDSTEQYYHAIALDERKGMSDWQEDVFQTLNTTNTLDLQLILEIPHDHTLKLSEHGEAIYSYVHGHYHASAGRWSRALSRYEQALTLFRRLDDVYYEICVLRAIGDIKQSDKKHWEEALEYYNQALYLTRQQRNSIDEADLLLTIGKVKLNDKNQWSDALEYYNQALALFRVQEKEAEEAQVLQAIGNLKQSENRTWRDAIEYYQQALHIFQSLQDANSIITILFTIGDVYQQHGHLKQALENYQQALQQYQRLDTQHITIAEREGYFELQARLHERIGTVQAERGSTQDAQESYQQSLTLYQYARDSSGENRILHALHKSQKFAPFRRLFVRVPQQMQFALIALILLLVGGSVGGAGLWWFTSSSSTNTCLPQQTPTQAMSVITTQPSCGSELIGISDGSGSFFYNNPKNKDLKTVAANIQQHANGAYQLGIDAWQKAIDIDPGDAESYIYHENLQVIQTHKPYVTFVVATILTSATDERDFVGGGQDILQGAYMAQKENNDRCQNSNTPCTRIRLLIANAGGAPSYASYIANQVVLLAKTDQTFAGVTGWGTSAHTLKAVPILAAAHIPVVASTTSSDQLTGISPYFFRVNPTDSQQGKLGAQYARQQLDLSTAALFYDPNDAYSNSLASAFRQEFTKEHGEVINTETYTVGEANGLLNQLRHTLATSHPQIIYFSGYAQDISSLLLYLKDQNIQVKIMGGSALYIPGDYKEGAQNADFEQLYFTSFASPDAWQHLGSFQTQPAFFANYSKTFDPQHAYSSTTYGYDQADSDVILTYDAINVLLRGYQNAAAAYTSNTTKNSVTPEDLKNGLAQINTAHPLQGVSGSIAFDQNGNAINKPVFVLHGSSIDNVTVQPFTPIQ